MKSRSEGKIVELTMEGKWLSSARKENGEAREEKVNGEVDNGMKIVKLKMEGKCCSRVWKENAEVEKGRKMVKLRTEGKS